MQTEVYFLGYVKNIGEANSVLAKFSDPTGESGGMLFTKNECAERLATLKANDFPHLETQKAIDEWPEK